MNKISQHPHRFAAFIALLIMFATIPLSGILVVKTISDRNSQARAATSDVPLIDREDNVVISERKVCSLVGTNQSNVGIRGEDGGASAKLGNASYFTFGDTTTNSGMIPNSSAVSADTDASDCITMGSKSANGVATPTLPKIAGECTVWPTDIVNSPDNKLHYLFSSLDSTCKIQHVGLAEMDQSTMDSTRVVPVFFKTQDPAIPSYKIFGAAITREGGDVYVFWGGQRLSDGRDVVLLSKVPAASINSKAAYLYWDGNSFQANPGSMVPLWDQGAIGTNGMTIRFNSYLNKWTAIYNTGYVSVMAMRVADKVTGPWSGEKTLINCLNYFPLSDSPNGYPCYGAREHPEYQKNNGQTIYVSHSNTDTYQPYLHEINFGKAVNQWVDASGNAAYKDDSLTVAGGFSNGGIAFYASNNLLSGFSAIHEWVSGSERVYGASSPGGSFTDSGIVFYAPVAPQYLLAPIYQWDKGTNHRYSAIDLSVYGYTRAQIAFYARVTSYRVTDTNTFHQNGSFFQIGLQKNGDWVQGGHLKSVKFSGLNAGSSYSVFSNTPLLTDRFFAQNLQSDANGLISATGDHNYVSSINLGVFPATQPLITSGPLSGYWIKRNDVFPAEVGHQVNPYRKGGFNHSFFLTGANGGAYSGQVCYLDCTKNNFVLWTGAVKFCSDNLTLTPSGSTVCAKLTDFSLSGFTPNTNYDLYYCTPNCNDTLVKVIYSRTSDASGVIKYINVPAPTPTPTPTPSPMTDTDGDGFGDVVEQFIGTDPLLACGVSAWPPDFNDDKKVNSTDQLMIAQHFASYVGAPNYDKRYDLNTDKKVNSIDQLIVAKQVGKYCSLASPTPTPTPSPGPTPTPAPVAQACSVSPTSIVRGSGFTLSLIGFTGAGQQVSVIGALTVPVYSLGTITSASAVYTIAADAQTGLYRVRVDMGGGNFLYCTENLSVN